MRRKKRLFITCIILIGIIISQKESIVTATGGNPIADIPARAEEIGSSFLDSIPIEDMAETVNQLEEKNEPVKGAADNQIDIPEYKGDPYSIINGNVPFFTEDDISTDAFEIYSPLDKYGRCGVAYANVCKELMPTDERGEIGMVKPSGWCQEKYPGIVISDPPYLYNRCHLLGWQLTGENANEKNLITGTRYMNIDGMLDHENEIAEYVRKTNNHVLYRVTPIYAAEQDLLAKGVLMEAYSVEDSGAGIQFCIFVHNVQPGISIDYRTGESQRQEDM